MFREKDLIDVWFDSGSMPYAQWHYPFENKELIDNGDCFPADYIAEGVDQTRGWFYTLHAISTIVFGKIAYKNVISNGLVLDRKGQFFVCVGIAQGNQLMSMPAPYFHSDWVSSFEKLLPKRGSRLRRN